MVTWWNRSLKSPAQTSGVSIAFLLLLVTSLCHAQNAAGADQSAVPTRTPAVFDFDQDREPVASLAGKWRFQPGDDADGKKGWAQPNFDDSKWPLIDSGQGWETQGYKIKDQTAWYRAKVIIPAGRQPVALYLPLIESSYQVFCDGELLGGEGRLPPHPRLYSPRPVAYTIPQRNATQPRTISIAIRVWRSARFPEGGAILLPASIGEPSAFVGLINARDYTTSVWLSADALMSILGAIAGVAALAFFVLRPGERDYVWFSALLLCSSVGRGLDVLSFFKSIDEWAVFSVMGLLAGSESLAAIAFYRNLLAAKRGWLIWPAVGSVLVYMCIQPLFFVEIVSYKTWFLLSIYLLLPAQAWIIVSLAKGAVKRTPDARLLLMPAVFQGAISLLAAIADAGYVTGWYSLNPSWLYKLWLQPISYNLQSAPDTVFVFCAFAFLILRLNRTRRQEAAREREREAARNVQQVLIPEAQPEIPGFAIQSIYQPYGEVGGDFFQILAVHQGAYADSVLIAVGDVSGKGLPAAMTVSLLVGAFRTVAQFTQSPGEILSSMNERMVGRNNGGFTTCLVLRVDPRGTMTFANAGHVAPYCNGRELASENGLPLGLSEQAVYAESTSSLSPGDQVTMLTDGVVEARSVSGELFGFDRAAEISMHSAESIARTAQHFGQDDDITVLTLVFGGEQEIAARLTQ